MDIQIKDIVSIYTDDAIEQPMLIINIIKEVGTDYCKLNLMFTKKEWEQINTMASKYLVI